ncbi:MAG: transcriptional repressor [bacterium]|nr:transcriptional repressor [bacterium]
MSTPLKFSRQRESIKEYLKSTKEHPTADMVYQHVRQIYPKVSLGTVYRNLNLLTELGEITKVDCGDGYDHFDGNIGPHYHVVCNECGSVYDLEMESIDHINVIAEAHFKGKITGHMVMFRGICEKCLEEEN